MARLVVFDIDGTLTDTSAVDDECFRRSMETVFGIDCAGVDWMAAPDVVDATIASWLFLKHRGVDPSEVEIGGLVDNFVAELRLAHGQAPDRFRPIAGAVGLFQHLRSSGWHVALATGGWERSARFKLEAAGLTDPTVPLASSNDAATRIAIMRLALERSEAQNRVVYEQIVAVGDAPWDVRAASRLGWPLVGVGAPSRLLGVPAECILADLANRDAVDRALALSTLAKEA